MFLIDSDEEAAFREDVRGWLAQNLPADYYHRNVPLSKEQGKAWQKKLAERNWSVPSWPVEFGGPGLSIREQVILAEEMGRVGAPGVNAPGLNFLAPALMAFGTPEQHEKFLPAMRDGELIWAQGYSEPNAGSDLASLRTRADLEGDHFVVNGQKIWGRPHQADWIFTLVRTDQDATPKHAGISLLLIDLASDGVEVHGIDALTGDDEFGAVFFDNVKVPKENLVGPLNGGWKVANHVLSFERMFTGNPQHPLNALDRIGEVSKATGAADSKAFRDKQVKVQLDVLAMQALFAHAVELTVAGRILGADSSIMKIAGTETMQAVMDVALEAAGSFGGVKDKIATEKGETDITELFLQSRRLSIYGGANEIQRNVIAKRVLALPTK